MKILFVDNSADLQQKWIEPLREKGWGVVRARSVEDADRMMVLHGDGLQAIVVSEKYVSFAEKNDLVFVVLTQTWKDKEILAHQNSEHSAIGYVPYSSQAFELHKFFDSGISTKAKAPSRSPIQSKLTSLKATGVNGQMKGVMLDDYSDMLVF